MKKVVILMGILTMISSLFGCARVNPEEKSGSDEYKKIKSFYYNVSGYSPGFYYDIHPVGDKIVMVSQDRENVEKEISVRIDNDTMEELSELCGKLDVISWDKYEESNPDILDGSGFTLRITYEDGSEVNARGDNSFPKHYQEFEKSVRKILERGTLQSD